MTANITTRAGSVTMAFVGDICLGSEVRDVIRIRGAGFPFELVAPALREADIVMGNLECCLVDETCGDAASSNPMAAPCVAAAELKRAGFHVLDLANNHILDCGSRGLDATLRHLTRTGLAHFGAGARLDEAARPAVIEHRGRRISFIGAADHSRYYAGRRTPGVVPLDARRLGKLVRQRRSVDDLVVVALHADLEFTKYPAPWRVLLSRWLIDSGASMVIQHHPHVCQGIEDYRGGLIAYSLGNFIFHIAGEPYQASRDGTRDGVILYVHAQFGSGAPRLHWECRPITIGDDHRPSLSTPVRARHQLRDLHEVSRALGDPSALRRRWRERCWMEAKMTGLQAYYSLRRHQWGTALRTFWRTLVVAEERRWLYGLISCGYL